MIGVILWSDPAHQKAVVWCEDHGDLAYLARPDLTQLPDAFVDAGDVIEFDLSADHNTRRVSNVRLLAQAGGVPLINDLKEASAPKPFDTPVRASAQVIPLRANVGGSHGAAPSERFERQG